MFQLYYTLNTNIQTTDLKKAEKEEIVRAVKDMDITSQNAFFLLIYEHMRTNNDSSNVENLYCLPYEGIETDEGIEFNLAKMPIKLRRILYKFVRIIQKNENKS